MKVLLDTHVWLWWNTAPEQLADEAVEAIAAPETDVFLSAASVWEMAIKAALGRLPLPEPCGSYVERRLARDGVQELPVLSRHAAAVEHLEARHRDPFDRLLIVQARHESLTLMTADRRVLAYDGDIIDVARRPGRSLNYRKPPLDL